MAKGVAELCFSFNLEEKPCELKLGQNNPYCCFLSLSIFPPVNVELYETTECM